jgi:hypothetical protein
MPSRLKGSEVARNESRLVIYTWPNEERWTCPLLSEQQISNNVHAWQQWVQTSGLVPTGCWQTQVIMQGGLAGAT